MKRILVVDDDEAGREYATETLKAEGYEVLQARDGQEALEIVVQEDLDLVLTDVQMPRMDGLQLAAAIRERKPDLRILTMTASMTEEMARRISTVHLDGVLLKPVRPNDLLRNVEDALKLP